MLNSFKRILGKKQQQQQPRGELSQVPESSFDSKDFVPLRQKFAPRNAHSDAIAHSNRRNNGGARRNAGTAPNSAQSPKTKQPASRQCRKSHDKINECLDGALTHASPRSSLSTLKTIAEDLAFATHVVFAAFGSAPRTDRDAKTVAEVVRTTRELLRQLLQDVNIHADTDACWRSVRRCRAVFSPQAQSQGSASCDAVQLAHMEGACKLAKNEWQGYGGGYGGVLRTIMGVTGANAHVRDVTQHIKKTLEPLASSRAIEAALLARRPSSLGDLVEATESNGQIADMMRTLAEISAIAAAVDNARTTGVNHARKANDLARNLGGSAAVVHRAMARTVECMAAVARASQYGQRRYAACRVLKSACEWARARP